MTDVSRHDPWTFYCGVCGLPFMQSVEDHSEWYHDGRLDREAVEAEGSA